MNMLQLLLKPIASRLVAAGSGYLVAVGADAELSNQLMAALVAAVIAALDLAQAYKARKN